MYSKLYAKYFRDSKTCVKTMKMVPMYNIVSIGNVKRRGNESIFTIRVLVIGDHQMYLYYRNLVNLSLRSTYVIACSTYTIN